QLLLGFGEGAIAEQNLALTHPHRGRGGHRLQCLAGHIVPGCGQALDAGNAFLIEVMPLLIGHGLDDAFLVVHQRHVFHGLHTSSSGVCGLRPVPQPIIQLMPKRSVIMPKRLAQKVSAKGMVTWPPCCSWSNTSAARSWSSYSRWMQVPWATCWHSPAMSAPIS